MQLNSDFTFFKHSVGKGPTYVFHANQNWLYILLIHIFWPEIKLYFSTELEKSKLEAHKMESSSTLLATEEEILSLRKQ